MEKEGNIIRPDPDHFRDISDQRRDPKSFRIKFLREINLSEKNEL